jgi:acetylglutamate kinase
MGDRPVLVLKSAQPGEDEAFLRVMGPSGAEADTPSSSYGGGKEIAYLHGRLDVAYQTVEGLRVTSEESLRLVEMVLNGSVNTRLVRWLVNAGLDAVGLNGIDMGLVRVAPLSVNGQSLGRVGDVRYV